MKLDNAFFGILLLISKILSKMYIRFVRVFIQIITYNILHDLEKKMLYIIPTY